jgi:hypothetical protein
MSEFQPEQEQEHEPYSEADMDDLREIAAALVSDYIRLNIGHYIQPNFHDNVLQNVVHLLEETIGDIRGPSASAAGPSAAGTSAAGTSASAAGPSAAATPAIDITAIVQDCLTTFYTYNAPPRSSGNTFIRRQPNLDKMRAKIDYLTNVPQPEQRTTEWYEFRYLHLTASNIWKTFISESTRNQLIYEKCQPLNSEKYSGHVSLDSPMHWGQKYEPVSVMLYNKMFMTEVSDFGCIPHKNPELEFLAASPDGINTLATSPRYGRMLEVKNIVNREITGNPKLEYWVQMQLQMEVCDLNECDFLETRFLEYADQAAYEADLTTDYKGMMMLFINNNGQPKYEYAPLLTSEAGTSEAGTSAETSASEAWQDAMMEKNKHLMWLKNIYWKLDQLSCVLVLRNKLWFKAAVPQLKEIWRLIQTEKESGEYLNRGPKKSTAVRVKKLGGGGGTDDSINITMNSTCFINIL